MPRSGKLYILPFVMWLLGSAAHAELFWLSESELVERGAIINPYLINTCGGHYYNPYASDEASQSIKEASTEISADRSVVEKDGRSILEGDVEIRQGDLVVHAGKAEIDPGSRTLFLQGPLELVTTEFGMLGGNTELSLIERQFQMHDSEYALFSANSRGTAQRIAVAPPIIHVTDGAYTACPPQSNDWVIKAGDIEINHDTGWGTAHDMRLLVKDVPVLYLPYLQFPVDDRRKSGLLFPTIRSSDKSGIDIAQPLYLNLHPQWDATLTPRHNHDRGGQLEIETRYLLGSGAFPSEGSIGFAHTEQDRLFNDETRKIASWQHDGLPSRHWRVTTDINYVSDDEYLNDWGTSLTVNREAHLNRRATAEYLDHHLHFATRARAYQLITPVAAADEPYARLPELQVGFAERLWKTVDVGLDANTVRFERDNDLPGNINGERSSAGALLAWTYSRPWLHLQPASRWIASRYIIETDGSDREEETRYININRLDLRLFAERPAGANGWTQTLEPRLFYLYTPYEAQDALPLFDTADMTFGYASLFRENRFSGEDRYGDANQLSYALSSRWLNADGIEKARIGVGQIRYHDDRKVQVALPTETSERSPIAAEGALQLHPDWQVHSEAVWSEYESQAISSRVGLRYQNAQWHTVNVAWSQRRDNPNTEDTRQTDTSVIFPLRAGWALLGRWIYDHLEQRTFESVVGVEYDSCCWMIRAIGQRVLEPVDAAGSELEAESGFFLQIQLKGLGNIDSSAERILEDGIPGYSNREKHRR